MTVVWGRLVFKPDNLYFFALEIYKPFFNEGIDEGIDKQ